MYLYAINLYKSQFTYYLQTNMAPTGAHFSLHPAKVGPAHSINNPGWLRRDEKQKGYMGVSENVVYP